MAWKLSESSFTIIPEGTYIFKVTKVDWDEDFGKLAITLTTKKGETIVENYNLLNEDGEVNVKANNAYSFFARTALNNPSLDEIEHSDLMGCYIKAAVTHNSVPNKKDPSKTMTFAHLGDKSPASGFEEDGETEKAAPATKPSLNLDDILG